MWSQNKNLFCPGLVSVNMNQGQMPGGGVLPSKRILEMCRWMGSYFHNWTDHNGDAFLVEFLEWGRTFSRFLR